jgi:hypothetical protein
MPNLDKKAASWHTGAWATAYLLAVGIGKSRCETADIYPRQWQQIKS